MTFSVGIHHLVELKDCDPRAINDLEGLRLALLNAVEASGATIITDVFHPFSPHGVTGVIVIAESHVSIHTWPELGYAALDIFTCSHKMNSQLIVDQLKAFTCSKTLEVSSYRRGP